MILSHTMISGRILALFAATGALMTIPPAQAAALKTMPHGVYECAYPGDAAGPAWRTDEGAGFTLRNASSYSSANGKGTYILKGRELTFTRGPKKGERYRRSGDNALREVLADGSIGRKTCFRVGSDH